MKKKKGFVTIATGDKYYYQLAHNLLISYRYHSNDSLPFAILAEEENEYTAFFDDVVIIKSPYRTFMDKLWLLKICPYDENIFLDADSLVFGNLNEYWNIFKDATDFSSFGGNLSLHEDGGQYNIDGIWKYKDLITYKTWVHAGVMFVRNTQSLEKFYNDCLDIIYNYNKLHIARYSGSIDEATFGIACPMNNFKAVPIKANIFAFLPDLKYLSGDIIVGSLSYTTFKGKEIKNGGCLVHFTTRGTLQPFYVSSVYKLKNKLKGNSSSRIDNFKASDFYRVYLETIMYLRESCKAWFGLRPLFRGMRNNLHRILHSLNRSK